VGETTVTVSASGYETVVLNVSLQAGNNDLQDIGLSTSNPPPPPYTISGHVTIQGQVDNNEVTVKAENASSSDLKKLGISGGDYYLLVPPGAYTVTATKAGYTSDPPSKGVTVTDPNQPVRNINFTLTKNP